MNKASKARESEWTDLTKELKEKQEALETLIQEYNADMENWRVKVGRAVDELNDAIDNANIWRGELAGDVQAYVDDRTEAWLESDKGQATQSWIDELNTEIEQVEFDLPEEIELERDPTDELEQTPLSIEV